MPFTSLSFSKNECTTIAIDFWLFHLIILWLTKLQQTQKSMLSRVNWPPQLLASPNPIGKSGYKTRQYYLVYFIFMGLVKYITHLKKPLDGISCAKADEQVSRLAFHTNDQFYRISWQLLFKLSKKGVISSPSSRKTYNVRAYNIYYAFPFF